MTNPHTPTLSSIVDQLTARIEGVGLTGDPREIVVLHTALGLFVDYAMREERFMETICEIQERTCGKEIS